jgi:hypothetical protein
MFLFFTTSILAQQAVEMVRFSLPDSEKELEIMFSKSRPRQKPLCFLPHVQLYGVLLFRLPQALVACTRKRSLGQTHQLGDGNENFYVSTAIALWECHSAMAVDT